MRWTSEFREQMKEKVRSVLVRKPRVSQYELAKILNIDKDVALRLKKQVRAENTLRVSKQKIREEVGKMEMEYEQLALECWQIITNEVQDIRVMTKDGDVVEGEVSIPIRDKISAIKTLIDGRKTLFGIKFDAGIFSRKLGKLELEKTLTKEEQDLIKKAVELDYGKPDPNSTAGGNTGGVAGENKPE